MLRAAMIMFLVVVGGALALAIIAGVVEFAREYPLAARALGIMAVVWAAGTATLTYGPLVVVCALGALAAAALAVARTAELLAASRRPLPPPPPIADRAYRLADRPDIPIQEVIAAAEDRANPASHPYRRG
jgi:hypothetical protein